MTSPPRDQYISGWVRGLPVRAPVVVHSSSGVPGRELSHARVFGVDVLKCSRCQGKMRLIACIEEPDVAKKILEHLGLRAEPLSTLRAQAPPVTLELFPAA